MNVEKFNQVFDHIKAHPETWSQDDWHCGTTHCFAGHAQIMSRGFECELTAFRDASIYLELTRLESRYLFSIDRTLEDFQEVSRLAKNRGSSYFEIPEGIIGRERYAGESV